MSEKPKYAPGWSGTAVLPSGNQVEIRALCEDHFKQARNAIENQPDLLTACECLCGYAEMKSAQGDGAAPIEHIKLAREALDQARGK